MEVLENYFLLLDIFYFITETHYMKRTLSLAMITMILGCELNAQNDSDAPKNVILMIGDGMGLSQVSAAFYYQQEPANFERFTHTGLIKTSSSSHKITDSAAGATAFSSGIKTYNGAIGVDKDTLNVATIIETVEDHMNTGIIATSSITHATPASFYAHVEVRSKQEEIASYLHRSSVDFVAGGGLKYFNQRSDNLNLLDSLKQHGFVVNTTSVRTDSPRSIDSRYAYILAPDALPKAIERGDYLADATDAALDYLSKKDNGFFLLVEGSQIDWGGHRNDADYLINEVVDFDRTIGKVLDFAQEHPNTLVIVTADHETGGFTLGAGKNDNGESDYNQISPSFSTKGHSATLIPVFAYGTGAKIFSGIYKNTEIYHKIFRLLEGNTKQ